MPSIAVIIPTIGRESLRQTLESIAPQVMPGDEVIVVADGLQPVAAAITRDFSAVRYIETPATRCWGHWQRNVGLRQASADYLMFLDDDDTATATALADIRSAIEANPDCPLMFKITGRRGQTLWQKHTLDHESVSSQMFVTPNATSRLGWWLERRGGDHFWIHSCLRLWPKDSLVWIDKIICNCGLHPHRDELTEPAGDPAPEGHWPLSYHVYRYDFAGLGDQWIAVNHLLRLSVNHRMVMRISAIAQGRDVSAKIAEILSLLDTEGQLQITTSPATGVLRQEQVLGSHAYAPTKERWTPATPATVCYQFDGVNDASRKNPPPADLARLVAWCESRGGVRLGNHLTLAECVAIAARSRLFIGVCSGMSHLAHSVGTPSIVVEYQKPAHAYHRGKNCTICRGTDDAIERATRQFSGP